MAKLNDIIHRVKSHPGIAGADVATLPEDAFAFAVSQLIFPTLYDLSDRVGGDIFRKHYAFTDPTTATVTLSVDGTADLTDLITDDGLLLEKLNSGEIRHSSSPHPLRNQRHRGVGAGNYDHIYLHYWLEGTTLHTRSGDNNATPLAGDLTFSCPRRQALDTLNVNLEAMLVDMLVARLRGAPLKEAAPQ